MSLEDDPVVDYGDDSAHTRSPNISSLHVSPL